MIITLVLCIPAVWRYRELADIKTKRKALLFAVILVGCSTTAVSLFYNVSMALIPGILHSGVFGFFCFGAGFIFVFSKLAHRKYGKMLDIYAIVSSVYGVFNRLCCVVNGCCSGKKLFDSFFWPNRELEILYFIIIFFVLAKQQTSKKFDGQSYLVFMMSYCAFRFVNEWFSLGQNLFNGVQIAHLWSVFFVICGYSIYIELKQHSERGVLRSADRRH